jgi:hypothetical protein
MAINFPDNPSNGATHVVGDVTFTYNSTKTLWVPSTAAATIHDTPVDGSSTIAISSNWAFDSVKTNVPTGALFTDTDVDWTVDQSATAVIHANNYTDTGYTHPTHNGDDFSVDTTALTGATVVSDIDINVTTDTLGHVTDTNGSVSTRTLTLADLGYTGSATANDYTHPTGAGNKHIPTSGSSGEFLKYDSSGTAVWATPSYTTNTDTTYTAGTGLTLSTTQFNVDVGTTASKIIQLNASGQLPAVDGSLLTNLPSGGSSVDIQDTPPTSASAGDLWINSTSMKLNVYYTDTDSSQWVETNTAGSNNYVDGVSLGGSTLTLTRSGTLGDLTADLSSLSGDYVDSAAFNNTTRDLTIGRTGSLADLTVNIPAATNTSAINEVEYTATAGQTVFSMTYDSTEDTLTLYINGVKQVSSSYTAVTGTSNNVTLNSGASLNDEITIVVVSTLFVNEQIVGKSGNNGQASIPAGTDAQRTTGATGNLRFNTEASKSYLEVYDSAAWYPVLQSGTNFEYEKIHPKSVTQTSTAIDMDNNNIYYLMSSNTTFQIQNHSNTGRSTIFHLDKNTSGYAPTFPATLRWAGGIEPTWTDHRDWIINIFASGFGVFCSATGYDR